MQGYRPQLDSLRAIAVTAVLLAHFWIYDTQLSSLGVRLFFVLSGFLLTSILLKERHEATVHGLPRTRVLVDFYARRILRIWPAYYFALIAAVAMGAGTVASTFGWHALFASNILFFLEQRWYPPVTAHLWTLSVEEQFYLVLPLVLLFLPRRLLRPLLVACIAGAILYRVAVAVMVSGSLDFYVVLPIAQLDALCGGALLALVQRNGERIAWKPLLAWSLPAAVILDILPLAEGVDFTLVAALYLLPMIALVSAADAGIGGPAGAVLSSRPLVGIGRISYGIYLYHLFVLAAFNLAAERFGFEAPVGPLAFVLLYALTASVAVSWIVLERPALSLRSRFRRATRIGTIVPAAPTASGQPLA